MADTIDPLAVAREMFRDQPSGFPFSNFEVAELLLPDGDDMGVRSDEDDVEDEQIETETGFGNVIGERGSGVRTRRVCYILINVTILQSWTTCPASATTSTKSS